MDEELILTRREILLTQAQREIPRILLGSSAVIVIFDLVLLFAGSTLPPSYYVSDAIQLIIILLAGGTIYLFKKPSPLTPWLFACAVIANNVAMNFQFVLDPSGNAIAVIMIMISVTGALIMDWRAFTFTMLSTGVATTWTLLTYMHVGAEGWIVAAYTAMGMSALILWGRSQTAGRLAQASLLARELATTDSLTGLLNRRGIDLEEVNIHRRAIREKSTIFAMFCDIEGLKLVNDTDGHSAGDLLLVSMSDALTRAVRPDDLVARWGGDEFVIVGVGQSPDPDEFIERLHTQLAQSPLPHSWDRGVTVGIASGEVDSLPEIIEQADINMYQHRNRP